jgi:hypothetical protein
MRQNIFTAKLLSLFSLLLCNAAITAQVEFPSVAIGQWSQHLPWQRAVSVTQSDTKIFYATEWAVVEIDKADRSAQYLTKVEGLSDVSMNFVRYNQAAGVLLLAYSQQQHRPLARFGQVGSQPALYSEKRQYQRRQENL